MRDAKASGVSLLTFSLFTFHFSLLLLLLPALYSRLTAHRSRMRPAAQRLATGPKILYYEAFARGRNGLMNMLKTMRNMGSLKLLLWIIVISFIAAMFTRVGNGEYGLEWPDLAGRGARGEGGGAYHAARRLPPAIPLLRGAHPPDAGDNFRERTSSAGPPETVAEGMVRQLILADMARSLLTSP